VAVALVLGLTACSSSSSGGAPSSNSPAPTPVTSSPAPTPTPTPTPTPSVSDAEAGRLPTFPQAPNKPALPSAGGVAQVDKFITAVFDDAQADWKGVFASAGETYTPAKLVLFSSAVRTGCGTESSEVGPFYCPADHTVYLDVAFFDEMERKYGVTGDFSMAFVVAHELGHHIQTITGLSAQVAQRKEATPAQANTLSVLTELQADCYAGVWAHSTYRRGLLEAGDLDEALVAAASVGDDFLQQAANGTVRPEQWTHGSSAQRQQWLTTGYDSGQPSACNTFAQLGG
jgi:uncharacterized protein